MDTTTLVERDLQAGQRLLDRLAGEGFPVKAACWVKEQNRSKPTLFIATPLVDEKGSTAAHHELHPILKELDGGLWFHGASARLVGAAHPLVRELQTLPPYQREGLLSSDISMFGGMAVDEVYVYPPSEAFPGFNQIKQRFPSAEVFALHLPVERLHSGGMRWASINPLMGKVNATEFEGKPPETLLFLGGDADPIEKVKRLVFVFRPEEWNTQYDDNAKQWRRVVFAETNRPLYEPADFTPLAALKSPPAAASA